MPERDLCLYANYATQVGLPYRRMEIYSAQQAFCAISATGAYRGSLEDFLLTEQPTNNKDISQEEEDWQNNPLFAGFCPD